MLMLLLNMDVLDVFTFHNFCCFLGKKGSLFEYF